MFLNGLEESPYTGWTLSGIAQCGPRLYLSGGGQDECASTTGWTNVGGLASVQSNRFSLGVAAVDMTSTGILCSNNFDLRWDWDVFSGDGNTSLLAMYVNFNDANYYGVTVAPGNNGLNVIRSPSSASDGSGTLPSTIRSGTLRMTRVANVFTSYYLNPYENVWTQIATGTHAYSTTATNIEIQPATHNRVAWIDSIRNVVPTVTTGTATSPVMDTIDGFRGVGWFVQPDLGTGTILVEYRTGPNVAACSAASYVTATSFSTIVPTAQNRCVQVRLTISSGSTTAASPEVGPILVNGSLDQATSQLLFKRTVSAMCRHTNASYQLGVLEIASATTALWGRAMLGLGRWVTANGANITFEGTTWALDTYGVQGSDATITANAASASEQVEAAYTILPGLYAGRTVFIPVMTGGQKTTWTTDINARIGNLASVNWNSFALVNRLYLTALKAYDGASGAGQWTKDGTTATWVDSDSDANITNLTNSYVGQGAFEDSTVNDHHSDDSYSNTISLEFGFALLAKPGYSQASTITTWMQQADRSYRQVTSPDGVICYHGRSIHSAQWFYGFLLNEMTAETASGNYATARELASTAVWGLLRFSWLMGHDFPAATLTRPGNTASLEGYVSPSLVAGENATSLGVMASSSTLYSIAPSPYDGEIAGATIWAGPAVAVVYGGGVNEPQLQSHALCSDLANGYASKYAARILADRYGQNTALLNTNAPNPQGAGFYYHDNSLSAGNNCSLQVVTTYAAYHMGQAAATWRTGIPGEYSATINGTAVTGATQTEIIYLRGHHAVVVTKCVFAAGHTCVNMGYAAPAIPLRTADVLTNTATTTAYAYAEGPASASGSLARVAMITGITANLIGAGIPRTGTDFIAAGSQNNRMALNGESVDLFATAGLTGTNYFCCDMAFSRGAMVKATETAYVGSYSQVGDVVTFDFDANGVVALEKVYLAFTAQNLTNQAVGNYTITGSAVKAFSGKDAAADWWGGSDLTSVSFNAVVQATLQTAGNLSIYKIDLATTRVWANQGDITLNAACLPANFGKVYAYRWDGVLVDVTSSCTMSPGVSVVIPSAVVTTYSYGIAKFDVTYLTTALDGTPTETYQGPGGNVQPSVPTVGGWC